MGAVVIESISQNISKCCGEHLVRNVGKWPVASICTEMY